MVKFMSAEVALELPQLPHPTLIHVIKDLALRWLTDMIAKTEDSAPRLEAVADYPLPKPASIGAGVFNADIAIRDARANKTLAIVLLAAPGESAAQLQSRVEPYLRFVEASPHVFGTTCTLMIFLPRTTRVDLSGLSVAPVFFTY